MAVEKDLGKVTAYAYAKAAGYTGTEEQFQQVFNEFTENAPGLLDRLDDAVADAEAAQAAAQTAVTNANTAKNAAEAAQAAAEQTAQDMDDSVQQITTNKNDISDLKESIKVIGYDTSDPNWIQNQFVNRSGVVGAANGTCYASFAVAKNDIVFATVKGYSTNVAFISFSQTQSPSAWTPKAISENDAIVTVSWNVDADGYVAVSSMTSEFSPSVIVANGKAYGDAAYKNVESTLDPQSENIPTSEAVADYVEGVKNDIDESIADLAPVNSPVFSGSPQVPTAQNGSSNNQIANTKYVELALLEMPNYGFVRDQVATRVPIPSVDGSSGQLLRTNGDGTTSWVSVGLPTDAQTQEAINTWLTAHPEATTTVQNGSITRAKLSDDLSTCIPENSYYFSGGTASEFIALVASGDYKNIFVDQNTNLEFSAPIAMPVGTVICGNGATFKRAANYTDILFDVNDNCEIHNVKIDGNNSNVTGGTWSGTVEIHIGGDNVIIDNVYIDNGCEGIMVDGDDCIVEKCTILNCLGNGIHLGNCHRTAINNNYIKNTNLSNLQDGFNNGGGCIYFCQIVHDTIIDGNYLENGYDGITGLDCMAAESDNTGIKITNNKIVNCRMLSVRGQAQTSVEDISAKDIIIIGNTFQNVSTSNDRFLIGNPQNPTILSEARLIIQSNIFKNVRLVLSSLKSSLISNNYFEQESTRFAIETSNLRHAVIQSNRIVTEGVSVYLGLNTIESLVQSNEIETSEGASISIDTGSYGNTIIGNVITNNSESAGFVINPKAGTNILNNRIVFSHGDAIVAPSNGCIFKNNIMIATVEGLTAIRAYGGTENTIISENVCNRNAQFRIASITNGLNENNFVWSNIT